jgi:hypothetical protein
LPIPSILEPLTPHPRSIGTENLIPEELNHSKIAVRMPVMNEVQFLFPLEPLQPR